VSLSFSTYTSEQGNFEARRLKKQASNKEEEPPLLASKFKNFGCWLTYATV
jgi:hypothetical protein